MNPDDRLRLRDMLDYSREVVAFVEGKTSQDLESDLKLLRAVTYSTGIVGEAASHISKELRDTTPEIPWRKIIGMRNFLFHEYLVVNPDILWQTAAQAIPDLIVELEKIVPPEPE